jgi:GNAT superfamily N-acetyltransferase
MKVVSISNDLYEIVEREWLVCAAHVHRQLRPHLPQADNDYANRMTQIISQGAEMAVAVEGDDVFGVTVFRVQDRTVYGLDMYCDDLVVDEAKRSVGAGKALIQHMEAIAKARGCTKLTLDSGTQRQQAHKFYFREGFTITSFHFGKPLK